MELEPLGDFYGYQYEVRGGEPADRRGGVGAIGDHRARRMSTGFTLPFTVRSTIEYDTGLRHALLLLSTPIDDERVVLHLRRVAQRRLLGAGRRGDAPRPSDRRRGQADARAGAGAAAAGRHRPRERAGRPGVGGVEAASGAPSRRTAGSRLTLRVQEHARVHDTGGVDGGLGGAQCVGEQRRPLSVALGTMQTPDGVVMRDRAAGCDDGVRRGVLISRHCAYSSPSLATPENE